MRNVSPALARAGFLVVLLILWEAACRLTPVSKILIAPASEIIWQIFSIATAQSSVPSFYTNAAITAGEIVTAFAVTATVGILLGLVFASSKLIGDAFEPLLLVVYAIPKVILYPLLILGMGVGVVPKIVFGILVGIFVVIFNTAAGLRQVEPNYVRLARSVGYGRWSILFKVVIPAAAPTILAGLRLGFGYTILGVIAGELLVVNAGLGFLIDWASVNYYTAQLYALIVVTLGLGAAGNALFGVLERRWVR
jgi:NitT/TauT family transport system permease protein